MSSRGLIERLYALLTAKDAELTSLQAEVTKLRLALSTLQRVTDPSAPGANEACPHGFSTFNMCGLCDDEAKDVARAALQEGNHG